MRLFMIAAAVMALMVAASPSHADADAIAFASNGAYGYGTNYPTRAAAERAAMGFCRSNGGQGCRVVMWTTGNCAALAVGNGNGYGTAWNNSASAASNRALRECRARTGSCRLLVNTCQ